MATTTAQRAIINMCGLRGLGTLLEVRALLATVEPGIANPSDLRKFLGLQSGPVRPLAAQLLRLMPRSGHERFGPYHLWFHIGDLLRGRDWMASIADPAADPAGTTVILQQLSGELVRDEDTRRRFEIDHRTLRTLVHPHVVSCLAHGITADKLPYRTIAFEHGLPLRTLVQRRGRLGSDEVLLIALHAGRGLVALHEQRLVHRDLSLDGLFMSSRGVVRIADVGRQSDRPPVTAPEVNSITPPENGWRNQDAQPGTRQWRRLDGVFYDWQGMPRTSLPPEFQLPQVPADARSDVYGLGLVLFEALLGAEAYRPPAGTGSRFAPQDLETLRRSTRDPLLLLILECLDLAPGRRPAAAALVARLEEQLVKRSIPLHETLPNGLTTEATAERTPRAESLPPATSAGITTALHRTPVSELRHEVAPDAAQGHSALLLHLSAPTGGLHLTLIASPQFALGFRDGQIVVDGVLPQHRPHHRFAIACPPGGKRPALSGLGGEPLLLDGRPVLPTTPAPLARRSLLTLPGLAEFQLTCLPRRSLRYQPTGGRSPACGIDADQAWDAVILSRRDVVGQHHVAQVLRGLSIGGPGCDLVIHGLRGGSELARIDGRWVQRPLDGGPWRGLLPGDVLTIGSVPLAVRWSAAIA